MLIFSPPKIIMKNLILFIGNINIWSSTFRAFFYSYFLKNIHCQGSKIRQNVKIYGHGNLIIKRNSLINEDCFLDCSGEIIIGENVAIGMRTVILSSTHSIGSDIRCGVVKRKQTIISDNVWIGANVTIFPGVIINEGAVISAGEVISKNIGKNMLVKNNEEFPIELKYN